MAEYGSILDEAKAIINGNRQGLHGTPEKTFFTIAQLWNWYLKLPYLSEKDVAMLMALMKIARIVNGVYHRDSFVDAVGYLALAHDLGVNNERRKN